MNLRHLALGSALLALVGCSGPYHVGAEVNSFGAWPAQRGTGSYAFERLPSQQHASAEQERLEASARLALEKAGFKPAADAKTADVMVTLGLRISAQERAPWDDPLWWRWHGSYTQWRYGPGFRVGLNPMWTESRFERSAALLLRDRVSGQPLYEARASNEGMTMGNANLAGALFEAAMSDFPKAVPGGHRVTVQVQR